MSQTNQCPECGEALPANAPSGLCPACLLKRGLESNTAGYTAEAPSTPTARWVPPSVEELATRFPELEIARLIGRGGMGAVYRALQKNLDRVVALKILPPEMGHDPAFAERFAREAQAMARLNHPHIVTIHEFGQRAGLYFFIMEFVDGVSLRGLLDSGHVAPKEALAIVPQICEALQYAHDQGIVHRDIKPENILINKQGQVKIADFGLAKLMGRAATSGGVTEKVMGTPQYMAPEQMDHPADVDHRADIYSLGVVFYQMLTGELPTSALTPPSRKVVIDVRLDEVVLRAMEKSPERRYQQASEVRTEVETIAGTPAVAAVPTGTCNPPGAGFEYRSRRTLLGLPWVHITSGIDPRTLRPRGARGIVAISTGKAVGCLALGSHAYGGLAFGGIAVGLFAFGGFGLGVITFAGFAAAMLLAIGGFAVGPLVFGGLAIGLYGVGGEGWGLHLATSTNRNSQIDHYFLPFLTQHQSWLFILAFGLSFGFVFLHWILLAMGKLLAARQDMPTGNECPRSPVILEQPLHILNIRDGRASYNWPGLLIYSLLASVVAVGIVLFCLASGWPDRQHMPYIAPLIGFVVVAVLVRHRIRRELKLASAAATLHRRGRMHRVLGAVLIAVVLALLVRTFVLQLYLVTGNAVTPEVPLGSRVLVYKLAQSYMPGDIALYHNPYGENRVARVMQAGPVDGKLQVQRDDHREAFELAMADVVGRVVLNTRAAAKPPMVTSPATQPAEATRLTTQWGGDFGPEVNGLRAAVEIIPPHGAIVLGEPIEVRFHVHNSAAKNIYLAGGSWRQDDAMQITLADEAGRRIPMQHIWYSGWTPIQRSLLEPGEDALFHSSGLEFLAPDADEKTVKHPVGNYVKVKPGRYTVSYRLHFPDLEGDGTPRPYDWQGDLETAPVTIDVKANTTHPAATQPGK